MRSRNWWLRLIAPPALVAAAISSIALATGASAGGSPALPTKTADQLLTMLRNAEPIGVHGTVVEQADLGLPDLPASIGGNSSTGLLGLTGGKHTLRVWEDGHARFRVQILDQLDETDLVSNGHAFWSYTYSTEVADEVRLPNGTHDGNIPAATAPTPGQTAEKFLAAIGRSTNVTTSTTARVAGRDAYTLDIEPLTAATTIGRVSIDIDALTGVPLRVRIYATAANSAAFSIGFTSVAFGAIDASLFDFTPPPNALVSVTTPSSDAASQLGNGSYLTGSGWTSIVVVPNVTTSGSSDSIAHLIDKMGQPVDGATLLRTTLVNALLTTHGRLLIGAVPASALQAAATAALTR